MYNKKECLRLAKERLKNAQVPDNRDEEFLLRHVLGARFNMAMTISEQEAEAFMSLIDRRVAREPMDSILGSTEFLGLNVPFSKYTLTPRQETEIMVDAIIKEHQGRQGLKVLDMCCGSGCIGVAVARHLGASVTLCDISEKALEATKKLAQDNNINVKTICTDLFENVVGEYDIIISNPPYIESQDMMSLEPEVADYDPSLALDGGEDGLDFYRKIATEGYKHLKDDGLIYLEFGVNQAEKITEIMSKHYKDIEVFKDYSRIDRYLKARK